MTIGNHYQGYLFRVTKEIVRDLNSKKIKKVKAIWEDNTAKLTFYFSEQPTEDELEDASIAATEIIAQFPVGLLEETYVVLDNLKDELPEQFLAYDKERD